MADEMAKMAFQFCSEATKQLITLSTAIVTLSIAVSKDLFNGATHRARGFLRWAWVVYLLSILCGLLTLLAMTGSLGRAPRGAGGEERWPSIYDWNVRGWALLQLATFVVATGLVVAFGWAARRARAPVPTAAAPPALPGTPARADGGRDLPVE